MSCLGYVGTRMISNNLWISLYQDPSLLCVHNHYILNLLKLQHEALYSSNPPLNPNTYKYPSLTANFSSPTGLQNTPFGSHSFLTPLTSVTAPSL